MLVLDGQVVDTGQAPDGADLPEPAGRPRLHVPAKAGRVAMSVALLRSAMPKLKVPRSRKQVKSRLDKIVDTRILTNDEASHRLMSAWTAAGPVIAVVPIVGPVYATTTDRLVGRFLRLKRPDQALELLRHTEGFAADEASRSRLVCRRLVMEMNQGIEPPSVPDEILRALRVADAAWAEGDVVAAAGALQSAFELAFHRVHHFEGRVSPLAGDPDGFLAPFRASTVFAALTSTAGMRRRPAEPPPDRALRVLFVSASNFTFASSLIADYESRPDLEVRTVNPLRQPGGPQRMSHARVVEARLRQVQGSALPLDDEVREPYDWADVIFVEWGHRALAWISTVPGLHARIVGRLHSYEAFTQFPLTTNWEHVDDQIFVSDHIRRLTETIAPALAGPTGPRRHVIPNLTHLDAYRRPKKAGAGRDLAMIGWGQVVKDPMWALDVLEELHRVDPSWKLRLIGHGFAVEEKLSAAARHYRDDVLDRIDRLGPAVIRVGFTHDIPNALRRVGVILSTSLREGTHEGLLQGAASGAVPVVRNWPFLAAYGGPRTMVPDEWVVETPQQAAQRILWLAQDEQRWADAGTEASEWVLGRYNWDKAKPRLDDVVLGRPATRTETREQEWLDRT